MEGELEATSQSTVSTRLYRAQSPPQRSYTSSIQLRARGQANPRPGTSKVKHGRSRSCRQLPSLVESLQNADDWEASRVASPVSASHESLARPRCREQHQPFSTVQSRQRPFAGLCSCTGRLSFHISIHATRGQFTSRSNDRHTTTINACPGRGGVPSWTRCHSDSRSLFLSGSMRPATRPAAAQLH